MKTEFKQTKDYILVFTEDNLIKKQIDKILSALRPGYSFEPRYLMGSDDGRTRFYEGHKYKTGFLFKIANGFKQRLFDNIKFTKIEDFLPDLEKPDRMEFLKRVIPSLPFKPYKHQLKAFLALTEHRNVLPIVATGGGKSMIAYLALRYFHENNKKIILVVPTIGLVSQMHQDAKDYSNIEAKKKELNELKELLKTYD